MEGKVILVFGAHPDDPDFGCGATVAKYISAGASAYYVVCTDGSRGSRDHQVDQKKLIEDRHIEQQNAASKIGVKDLIFLGHEDGNLEADIHLKEEIVRIIRKYKPEIVFTHDPSWFYLPDAGALFSDITSANGVEVCARYSLINHSDHRQAGSAVIDAVYPLARDLSSFPNHVNEGLAPHKVKEVYFFNFANPNFYVDVTDTLEIKIQAVLEHKSQVDDSDWVRNVITTRAKELGEKSGFKYAEGFIRLLLR